MEWDPPSCKRCQGLLILIPTYVGTHRLTGDVQGGCVRNRCHTHLHHIYMFLLFRVFRELRQRLSRHLLRLRSK